MDVMVEELKRGLEAAYQLHIELTQRLIEKQKQNNAESITSMDHHIATILQTFQDCISRLRNPHLQDPSVAKTIAIDKAQFCDIGRIRQLQPVVITTEIKEDGFKWRKYGKKPILSSKYPREYYKCRYSENGCRAFKYVQMICDSPTNKYRLVYSGSHTCKHRPVDSPEILSFGDSSELSNIEPEQGLSSNMQMVLHEEKQQSVLHNALTSSTFPDFMAIDGPLWSPLMPGYHGDAEIDYNYLIDA